MKLRLLILLFLASCASVPKHDQLAFDESESACVITESDLELPFMLQTQNLLTMGLGSTSSIAVTTLGLASDVLVVGSTLIVLSPLCEYGCHDLPESIIRGFEKSKLVWSTRRAFKATEAWRCPFVDHVSRAIRKSAKCNYKRGNLVAANSILGSIKENDVLDLCSSDLEKDEVQTLMQNFKGSP